MKPRSILFVCSGNTCRSPMAESLSKSMLKKAGVAGIEVFSRGISAAPGEPLSEGVKTALKSVGIEAEPRLSQRLSAKDMERADWVMVMTEGHRRILLMDYAKFRDKIRLLGPDDIADPVGGSPNDYEKCRIDIQNALLDLLSLLKS